MNKCFKYNLYLNIGTHMYTQDNSDRKIPCQAEKGIKVHINHIQTNADP